MIKYNPLPHAMRYVNKDNLLNFSEQTTAHIGPPIRLRCEDIENPVGLDIAQPRLTWEINDRRRGAVQTAYQVLVSDERDALNSDKGLVWDSGKVESEQSVYVLYNGRPLKSQIRYYWKVRTWDAYGICSPWSKTAYWEMGLLDWRASWITSPDEPPLSPIQVGKVIWSVNEPEIISGWAHAFFRKAFQLENIADAKQTMIQIAADVIFVLHVNGKLVGSSVGTKWMQFDLKPFIQNGTNIIDVDVRQFGNSNGGLCCGIRIQFYDGHVEEILSDDDWQSGMPIPEASRPCKMFSSGQLMADETSWTNSRVVNEGNEPKWSTHIIHDGQRSPALYLSHKFELPQNIKQARAYVCGLGYHEFHINGRKIDDRVLEPAQTNYEQEAFYSIYDITSHVKSGVNAIGLILGDGWYAQNIVWGSSMKYGRPCAIAQFAIEYDNGHMEIFGSDKNWKWNNGAIRGNNVYWGEVYDARLEHSGWTTPEYDDTSWNPVVIIPSPTKRLVPQLIPPIRQHQNIPTIAITEPQPSVYIFDMGQNFAGWVRLRVNAPAGTAITLRFAELLGPDGMLDTFTSGTYWTNVVQMDTYICRGEGEEVWEPHFTYHGFRYVEVTGLPFVPGPELLEGVVIHTALDSAGQFECSNALINKVHDAALWTEVSNLHSIPTDCPTRERCGWLGDAHITCEMVLYNFLSAPFWRKFLCDIETSLIDGLPTMVAPGRRTCGSATSDWGTAMVQIPWFLYLYHGDQRILEQSYPLWPRWINHLMEMAGDDLIMDGDGVGLGDWCPPGPYAENGTPVSLTSTIYFFVDVSIAERVARLLGRTEDARRYHDQAALIREAFIKRFYDPAKHSFGAQAADAMALCLGLAPDGKEQLVADSLAHNIMEIHNGHCRVGIMGHRYIYEALANHRHEEAAYTLLTQTTWPSMGYLFDIGATTLWEVFGHEDNTEQPSPQYSLNHPMQGGFDAWFYYGIGGIRPDPQKPAFKHIILKPALYHQLEWAKTRYYSSYGLIVSEWEFANNIFTWTIRIPANTTATVYIPTANGVVMENDVMIENLNDIEIVSRQDSCLICRIKAGTYRFVTRKNAIWGKSPKEYCPV